MNIPESVQTEYEIALKWLYTQLKKKRVALGHAEQKGNEREINDIKQSIEIIEWIVGVVMKGNDDV